MFLRINRLIIDGRNIQDFLVMAVTSTDVREPLRLHPVCSPVVLQSPFAENEITIDKDETREELNQLTKVCIQVSFRLYMLTSLQEIIALRGSFRFQGKRRGWGPG